MSTIPAPRLQNKPIIPLRTNPVPGAGVVNRVVTPAQPQGPVQPPQNAVSETPAAGKRGRPKRERKEGEDIMGRSKHPSVGVDGVWPFANISAVPADFNFKLHQPLKRKDFVNDFDAMEWEAHRLETKAASLRKKAENLKTLGDGQTRKDQQRFQKMTSQYHALAAKLQGELGEEAFNALLASVQNAGAETA